MSLHKKFGKLEFKDLFDIPINLAENGFPVSEVVAFYLEKSSEVFKDYPNFRQTWMPNGDIPSKGDIFKNKNLASTYKKIANSYGDDFYNGEIAEEIVNFLNEEGGYFELSDLKNFQPEWIEPVSSNYRGYDVWELPPNGQGIAALQILNILEHFDISDFGFGSAEYIHLFTEAKKIAYEDRAKYYADPKSVSYTHLTLPTKRIV